LLSIENDIDKIWISNWDNFVKSHPFGTIFQSPIVFDLYKSTANYDPRILFCLEEGELVGVLLSVKLAEGKGLKALLTSRFIIHGGPIAKENRMDILSALLEHHVYAYGKSAIYTQVRNLFNTDDVASVFSKLHFKFEDHLDIHINLKIETIEFWNSLKPKLRQNIRKAEKNGVELHMAAPEDVKEIYDILVEVYTKAKLPIPPKSLVQSAFDQLLLSGNLLSLVAKYEGKIIGCRIGLLYKDLIYDWYAGSLTEYQKWNINDYLPYKTIEWGLNNSTYNVFDFGGAGKPGIPYGVRDHKLKFWDELINLGRYQKIHKPLIYSIMYAAFNIYQKVKKEVSR